MVVPKLTYAEAVQHQQRLCKWKIWTRAHVASILTLGSYFKPTEVSEVELQDGVLEHPNPADLAIWESRHIWPSITRPDVLLSLGNGKNAAVNPFKVDRFRRIFNGFGPRLCRTLKSRIDAEKAWTRFCNGLPEEAKQDYFRLNFTFPGAEPAIDDVDCMEELPKCITTPLHKAQVFKVFSALLVSSLFFELDGMPTDKEGSYHCKGSIRCRSGSIYLIRALTRYMGGVEFYKDRDNLGCMLDEADICTECYRYRRPVEFPVKSLEDEITLSIRDGKCEGRKISAMPNPITWFVKKQNLHSPFGSASHGDPGGLRCRACSPNRCNRKRPNPITPPTSRKRACRE